jgi:hypothetical protein
VSDSRLPVIRIIEEVVFHRLANTVEKGESLIGNRLTVKSTAGGIRRLNTKIPVITATLDVSRKSVFDPVNLERVVGTNVENRIVLVRGNLDILAHFDTDFTAFGDIQIEVRRAISQKLKIGFSTFEKFVDSDSIHDLVYVCFMPGNFRAYRLHHARNSFQQVRALTLKVAQKKKITGSSISSIARSGIPFAGVCVF